MTNASQSQIPDSTIAASLHANRIAVGAAAAGFIAFFWTTGRGLIEQWSRDDDYSFCFLVPVISLAILWADRKRLGALPARRSILGLVACVLALGAYLFAQHLSINLIARLAGWGTFVGAVIFCLGWGIVRAKAFPFLFLLFAIPPPFFVTSPIRLELKRLVTLLSTELLTLVGVPIAPDGNVLVLGEHLLEVADACTGIRSLMVIIATSVLFAYVFRCRWWTGALLVATAIPITVAANVGRIIVVAGALYVLDLDLTSGVAHEAVGMAAFVVSLVLLYVTYRFYEWCLASPAPKGDES